MIKKKIEKNINSPLISVVIPVYNAEQTIEKTIGSVLNQRYKNLEVITVDDGSDDESKNIIKKISEKNKKVRLISLDKNVGVAQARNIGIINSKGTYIGFLDSDDIWIENFLIEMLEEIANADVSFSAYYIKDKDSNYRLYSIKEVISYEDMLKENYIGISAVLAKKEILKNNLFSSDYFHEDYELWLRLIKNGCVLKGKNKPLVVVLKSGGRSSNKFFSAINRWRIYRKSQKLSIIQSCYYMVFYVINGIKKYKRI